MSNNSAQSLSLKAHRHYPVARGLTGCHSGGGGEIRPWVEAEVCYIRFVCQFTAGYRATVALQVRDPLTCCFGTQAVKLPHSSWASLPEVLLSLVHECDVHIVHVVVDCIPWPLSVYGKFSLLSLPTSIPNICRIPVPTQQLNVDIKVLLFYAEIGPWSLIRFSI